MPLFTHFNRRLAIAALTIVMGATSVARLYGDDPSRSAPSAADTADDDDVPIAAALLAGVINQLPREPIRVTGTLLVRRRRGVPISTYGFELIARWGDAIPRTRYTILDAFGEPLERLELTHGESPTYDYAVGNPLESRPVYTLDRPVQSTDITWMDLTLSFLWWQAAMIEGADRFKGIDCHVIRVKAPPDRPGTYSSVRLWIGKEAGMMVKAEGLDAAGNPVRRLWIQSVQKIDDAYMAKDMEIQKVPSAQRTKLIIAEVERLQP